MRRDLFQPTVEGEARLLVLIAMFSAGARCLEGRTKLAKLDFFLRSSPFLYRALLVRGVRAASIAHLDVRPDIETKMVRFRYGPWDPAHYAILGRLIGKCLIATMPYSHGIGYRATSLGVDAADRLCLTREWADVRARAFLLRRHLDLSGSNLTKFIYENFPEVSQSKWGDSL